MRSLVRFAKAILALSLLLIASAILLIAAAFLVLRSSLPDYDTGATITSLTAPVTVDRDARAVPTIRAQTWLDAARALGFVHAQDRLFQMDLARRLPAGRLSEILGPSAVDWDKSLRRYRFDHVARQVLDRLPQRRRDLLAAYTDGVNAYLALNRPRTPEYLILRTRPEPWLPVDSLLVNFNMHLGLSLFGNAERHVARMRDSLPPEVVDFLTPRTTQFDAPIIESSPPPEPPPIPGPDVIDLRANLEDAPGTSWLPAAPHIDITVPGSNSFAVSGARTADSRAILENDMHLGLTAPNIWYIADLHWNEPGDEADTRHSRAIGLTLPGVPGIIAGTNTFVAWGFTNVTGDFADYIVVETLEDDPSRYHTPDGPESFTEIFDTIDIRGGSQTTHTLRSTRWGPVFDTDHKGRPLVLRWTATDPDRTNLAIIDIVHARSLEQAVDTAHSWRGPPQNVLIASRDGRIAWVVAGDIPNRVGFDGTLPTPRTDPSIGWLGSRPEEERPVLIDPPSGFLFTANHRTLPLDLANPIGHNWAPPFRARRIRDRLSERATLNERTLLDIATDTRLEALDFYRDLILETVPDDDPDRPLAWIRSVVAEWDGHARADSPALPILIRFRKRLMEGGITPILMDAGSLSHNTGWLNSDEPLRRLLQEQPHHLLGMVHSSWPSMIRRSLELAAADLHRQHPESFPHTTWGDDNRARTESPLTFPLDPLIPFLDMPPSPQQGHPWCVRVAAPTFGASERLVVSPGHEQDAILQMPTGQSAHPLSRHYRDLHDAWLDADPVPLLPGEPLHSLTLTP